MLSFASLLVCLYGDDVAESIPDEVESLTVT
jgi:hypothetical protein